MSRKYRQDGYMDRDREKTARSAPSPHPPAKDKDLTFGPRFIQMAGNRSISRCAMCGTILQAPPQAQSESELLSQCLKCGAELHSCRQCSSFDPGGRFECSQPVKARIEDKNERNECQFYSLGVKVEKETSTGGQKVDDARAAFDRLFKK